MINTEDTKEIFTGNDSATAFPFDFKTNAAADLEVGLSIDDAAPTVLALNVNYSVVLNDNQNTNPGGTITYPLTGDPLSTDEKLYVRRNMPALQPTPFTAGIAPATLEAKFDNMTMLVNQLQEQVDRSIKGAVTDTAALPPLPYDRAGKFIAFDASRNPTVSAGTGADAGLREDLASTDSGKGADLVYGAPRVINVLNYGLKPDGETDNQTAFSAMVADAPEGSAIYFPVGDYFIPDGATNGGKILHFVGAGTGAIIRADNSTAAISITGTNAQSNHALRGFRVINENAAGDGVLLTLTHRSAFQDVIVLKAAVAGWRVKGNIFSQFVNCSTTVNDSFPENDNTAYGLVLDISGASPTNGCQFLNFAAEGATTSPGIGIDCVNGIGNIFIGGGSEGNTIGIRFAASPTVRNNVFLGFWMEGNGTDFSGTVGNNVYIGRRSGDASLKNFLADYGYMGHLRLGNYGDAENTQPEFYRAGNMIAGLVGALETSQYLATEMALYLNGTGGNSFIHGIRQTSSPDAPAALHAIIFARLNGSNKMEWVARFPTGAEQVFAVEP